MFGTGDSSSLECHRSKDVSLLRSVFGVDFVRRYAEISALTCLTCLWEAADSIAATSSVADREIQRRGIFFGIFFLLFFVLAPVGFVASVASTVLAPGGSWWLRWLLLASGASAASVASMASMASMAPGSYGSSIIYRSIYQWSMFTRCMLCIRNTSIYIISIFLSISTYIYIYISTSTSISIPISTSISLSQSLISISIYTYIYIYLSKRFALSSRWCSNPKPTLNQTIIYSTPTLCKEILNQQDDNIQWNYCASLCLNLHSTCFQGACRVVYTPWVSHSTQHLACENRIK